MKRVFNNLISNAIQAIPEDRNGKIDIVLGCRENTSVVTFKDNGKGIAKEDAKKVFVPNFSTKTSGMGLGLAISRKIIETAGGRISFESQVGKGTTFTIELPLKEKEGEDE